MVIFTSTNWLPVLYFCDRGYIVGWLLSMERKGDQNLWYENSCLMKSESPGKKNWRRFRRNKLAVFGMAVIVISFFVAAFCYLFMPDNSPMANRMNLSICNQPPGFATGMLLVKRQHRSESSFFSELFLGKEARFDMIPISSFRFEGTDILYDEFTGADNDPGMKHRMNLGSVTGETALITEANSTNESIEKRREEIRKNNFIIKKFLLGTDRYGRDLLSRLLAGTRVTVSVGLIAVLISLVLGILFGSLAGFFRGWVDEVILWLINVVWSIPTLLLVIAITLVMGKGFEQVFIAVGCTMWVEVARIVRGQIFSIRELEFVDAGRALGFRNGRIILKHILPNIFGPIIVVAASNFSAAVLLEAGLSFLGIGAQPPMPSWGAMIKENYGYIIIPHSAYLAILPGLAIMLLAMAFAFVGSGFRDAIDSRQQASVV